MCTGVYYVCYVLFIKINPLHPLTNTDVNKNYEQVDTQIESKWFCLIQINQPTTCNSFTSLLLDVYVWLNMFRALPHPSSGAYNCISNLWFLPLERGGSSVVGRGLPDHNQQRSNRRAPTVKPEAPSAVVRS